MGNGRLKTLLTRIYILISIMVSSFIILNSIAIWYTKIHPVTMGLNSINLLFLIASTLNVVVQYNRSLLELSVLVFNLYYIMIVPIKEIIISVAIFGLSLTITLIKWFTYL